MNRDLNGFRRLKYNELDKGVHIYRRTKDNRFEDWGVIENITPEGLYDTDKVKGLKLNQVSLWTHCLTTVPDQVV
jgi:hypothetical protein